MMTFDAVNESCELRPTCEPRPPQPTISAILVDTHKLMLEADDMLRAIAAALGHIDFEPDPQPRECACIADAAEINLERAGQLCRGLHKVLAVLQ